MITRVSFCLSCSVFVDVNLVGCYMDLWRSILKVKLLFEYFNCINIICGMITYVLCIHAAIVFVMMYCCVMVC